MIAGFETRVHGPYVVRAIPFRRDVMPASPELRPILVIDDDPDVGFLMHHILKKSGVRNPVQSVSSAREAMTLLEALAGAEETGARLPLFILVDLKMPEVSGFEFLTWMGQNPRL